MTASAVRRNGPFAPLGANYADDDAIATLDLEENDRAEVLFTRGLAYCARDLRLEGFISDIALRAGKVLRRRPGKKGADTVLDAAQRLVELGVWTRVDGGYLITNWLKWNKSWEEISKKRAEDRGRKGGRPDPDEPPDDDGSRADSARTDTGVVADSARKPSGVVAPKHVTSQHTTSHHGTDRSDEREDVDVGVPREQLRAVGDAVRSWGHEPPPEWEATG